MQSLPVNPILKENNIKINFKYNSFALSAPAFYLALALLLVGCIETVPLNGEIVSDTATMPSSYVPTLLQQLDSELEESSGLAYFGGKVWTVNDSGNENIVYQLDTQSGKASRRVRVSNAENIDWESLAQSDTHLFVGDFGNNEGNRTDLVVLKILKNDLLTKNEVSAEKIHFSYPRQDNFEERMNSHNFDCEAFFYSEGLLHLFTKNWENSHTDYYTLGIDPGTTKARHKGQFNSEGLITGADIDPASGNIVFIGYENKGIFSQSFLWFFSDYPDEDIFGGKKSKIMLGSPADLGQTEAIHFKDKNSGLITSEAIEMGEFHVTGKLFTFDFSRFF